MTKEDLGFWLTILGIGAFIVIIIWLFATNCWFVRVADMPGWCLL